MRVVVAALFLVTAACQAQEEASVEPTAAPHTGFAIARPDSSVLVSESDGCFAAISTFGQRLWSACLPDKDVILPPIAVAPDASAYVLGRKGVYAYGVQGDLVWQTRLMERPEMGVFHPLPLPNSGVALVRDRERVEVLGPEGIARWVYHAPNKELIVAPLTATSEGTVVVTLETKTVGLGAQGQVVWTYGRR